MAVPGQTCLAQKRCSDKLWRESVPFAENISWRLRVVSSSFSSSLSPYLPLDPHTHYRMRAQDATKARFKEMVREIGERRDSRDDGDGPVPGESLWAAKPDLNMQQVTAQVSAPFRL